VVRSPIALPKSKARGGKVIALVQRMKLTLS